MSFRQISLVLLVVLMMAGGQILFKLAAQDLSNLTSLDVNALRTALTSVPLIAGIVLYTLTTVLWVLVLREVDLSRSYPFVALTMVIVPLAGILLFREPVSLALIVGGGLIASGVLVISLG